MLGQLQKNRNSEQKTTTQPQEAMFQAVLADD